MKPFKFRLDPVLRWRSVQDKQKTHEESIVRQRLQEKQKDVDRLRQLHDGHVTKLAALQKNPFSPDELRTRTDYIHRLGTILRREEEQLSLVLKDFQSAKKESTHASQKKKILESLEHQQFDNYRSEQKKRESEKLDDFIQSQINRERHHS